MRGRSRQHDRPPVKLRPDHRRRFKDDAMVFSRIRASHEQQEPIGIETDAPLQRRKGAGITTREKLLGDAVRDDGNLVRRKTEQFAQFPGRKLRNGDDFSGAPRCPPGLVG
jgi:hypothetical protein